MNALGTSWSLHSLGYLSTPSIGFVLLSRARLSGRTTRLVVLRVIQDTGAAGVCCVHACDGSCEILAALLTKPISTLRCDPRPAAQMNLGFTHSPTCVD